MATDLTHVLRDRGCRIDGASSGPDRRRATRCNAWLRQTIDRRSGTQIGHGYRRWLAVIVFVGAAGFAAQGGWIHAKAILAQQLLQNAWERTIAEGGSHAPWPWADTAPIARLTVPALGIDQIVLAGDSGRTLAFGPGWAEASALPGAHGTIVLSGHRDTHFAFLRELVAGDVLHLQSGDGDATYRVLDSRIADSRTERLTLDAGGDVLWLVTCWPFDAVEAGGPMRYAVRAAREEPVAALP